MQVQNASDMEFLTRHMAMKEELNRYRKALEEIAAMRPGTVPDATELAERALLQ